jgi:hypothetical protein
VCTFTENLQHLALHILLVGDREPNQLSQDSGNPFDRPPMSSALVCNLIHLEAKSGSLATPSAMTYVSLTLRCAPSPRLTGWRRHHLPCRNQSSWAVAVLSPPPLGSVRHAHDHPDKAASQSPQPADAMGERGTPHGFE